VLLALLNVLGSSAFSYNSPSLDLDPRKYDYLQEGQNTSALFLEEISACGRVQVITKDLASNGDYIYGRNYFSINYCRNANLSFKIIRDEKDLLKTFIYPFHFFW